MKTIKINSKTYHSALNPRDLGYEDCRSGHFFGPAIRNYWLIHFVKSGCGRFVVGDRTYTVSKGEMFVIPPGVVTYYEADKVTPWSYIWLGFESEAELPIKLSDVIYCPEALGVFEDVKESVESGRYNAFYITSKIWRLFAYLGGEQSEESRDFVAGATEYINTFYGNNELTVERIADEFGINRSYFTAKFTQKNGVSPKQYLTSLRMSKAAELMIKNGETPTIAAYSVGYTDFYNFSKMFKKHFGLSPRSYVKENQKGTVNS